MKILSFVLWLAIFIIGSLIVTFLVSPNSFYNFKQNIKSLIPQGVYASSEDISYKKDLIAKQYPYNLYNNKDVLESLGREQGLDAAELMCRELKKYSYPSVDSDLIYDSYSYDSNKDLICYYTK